MKIILLIYCTSLLCVAFSFPNNSKGQQQKETHTKRDTSYSYVAADINSKEGTHIKTIAVLQNTNSRNNDPVNLNRNYHKDNKWTDKIHENFEAFGKIPEIPDIDDLFEFTKNFNPITHKSGKDVNTEIPKLEKPSEADSKDKESEKPISPAPTEEIVEEKEKSTEKMKEIKIQSIPDDVELISTETNLKQKSQSLHYVPQPQASKKINVKIQPSQPENKYLTEYSTPHHSVRQYFISDESEKSAEYKKIPTNVKPSYGNNFPVYSPTQLNNIHNINNPNGIGNGQNGGVIATHTNKPPYFAPNKLKKNQNNGKNRTTNVTFTAFTQTPYLAPSIKKPYEVQIISSKNKVSNQNGVKNQTNNLSTENNQTIVVPGNLRIGGNIPLGAITRSRGLKY